MNNQEQTQIGKLNVARQALEQAKSIQEIIKLDNLGEAISYYAKKEKLSLEIQNEAQTFVLDAKIKAGEYLAKMEKNQGGKPVDNTRQVKKEPTLKEMGITRDKSSEFQRLAKNKEQVEKIVKEKKEKKEPISKAAILKEISPEPKQRNTPLESTFSVMVETFTKHVAKTQKEVTRHTPTAVAGFIGNDLNEMVRVLESWKNPTLECHVCKGTGSYKQTGTVLICDRCIGGKVGLSLFMVKGK